MKESIQRLTMAGAIGAAHMLHLADPAAAEQAPNQNEVTVVYQDVDTTQSDPDSDTRLESGQVIINTPPATESNDSELQLGSGQVVANQGPSTTETPPTTEEVPTTEAPTTTEQPTTTEVPITIEPGDGLVTNVPPTQEKPQELPATGSETATTLAVVGGATAVAGVAAVAAKKRLQNKG